MKRFFVAAIVFTFLLLAFLSATAAFSQDYASPESMLLPKTGTLGGRSPGPQVFTVEDGGKITHSDPLSLSELDKYKLQAAEATANFETLRMDTIIRNFVESNPQVKAYNESANKAVTARDAMKTQLYQAAGLSPADYELKDGAFVKIGKAVTK